MVSGFWIARFWVFVRHPNLCLTFRRRCGHWPNVANPKTVEEKFLWRKVFDHNPRFAQVQDKIRVKEEARAWEPPIRVPETYWTGKDLAEVPRELLTRPAVLKPNQNWGKVVFLPEKTRSFKDLQKLAKSWLRKPYGTSKGEWAYREIPPGLEIEELIENADGSPLGEIKVYTCAGKVVHCACYEDRQSGAQSLMVVTPDGSVSETPLDGVTTQKTFTIDPLLPEAMATATAFAKEFDFMRVDFLVANGRLYLGESTVYPVSGYTNIRDKRILESWVRLWDLRKSWFLSQPQPGWRGRYAKQLKRELDQL